MSISAARRSLSAESTWMSPKPSACAAPGMESAIININGFFPFDIIYSIAHIRIYLRQILCDAIRPWIQANSKTSTQFTYVFRERRRVGGLREIQVDPGP